MGQVNALGSAAIVALIMALSAAASCAWERACQRARRERDARVCLRARRALLHPRMRTRMHVRVRPVHERCTRMLRHVSAHRAMHMRACTHKACGIRLRTRIIIRKRMCTSTRTCACAYAYAYAYTHEHDSCKRMLHLYTVTCARMHTRIRHQRSEDGS